MVPLSVRRTHIARSEIHKVAVLSDQHDVVRSVIFDDEVDRPQTLRDKSGALWLDPSASSARCDSPMPAVRLGNICSCFARSFRFAAAVPVRFFIFILQNPTEPSGRSW